MQAETLQEERRKTEEKFALLSDDVGQHCRQLQETALEVASKAAMADTFRESVRCKLEAFEQDVASYMADVHEETQTQHKRQTDAILSSAETTTTFCESLIRSLHSDVITQVEQRVEKVDQRVQDTLKDLLSQVQSQSQFQTQVGGALAVAQEQVQSMSGTIEAVRGLMLSSQRHVQNELMVISQNAELEKKSHESLLEDLKKLRNKVKEIQSGLSSVSLTRSSVERVLCDIEARDHQESAWALQLKMANQTLDTRVLSLEAFLPKSLSSLHDRLAALEESERRQGDDFICASLLPRTEEGGDPSGHADIVSPAPLPNAKLTKTTTTTTIPASSPVAAKKKAKNSSAPPPEQQPQLPQLSPAVLKAKRLSLTRVDSPARVHIPSDHQSPASTTSSPVQRFSPITPAKTDSNFTGLESSSQTPKTQAPALPLPLRYPSLPTPALTSIDYATTTSVRNELQQFRQEMQAFVTDALVTASASNFELGDALAQLQEKMGQVLKSGAHLMTPSDILGAAAAAAASAASEKLCDIEARLTRLEEASQRGDASFINSSALDNSFSSDTQRETNLSSLKRQLKQRHTFLNTSS